MTEPTYRFVKGQGWIASMAPEILTVNDCVGTWVERVRDHHFFYPPICSNWQIIPRLPRTELQVGDVIPYSGDASGYGASIAIVLETPNRNGQIKVLTINSILMTGTVTYLPTPSNYVHVARQF